MIAIRVVSAAGHTKERGRGRVAGGVKVGISVGRVEDGGVGWIFRNVDVVIVLSAGMSLSGVGRSSISRHSAKALVRRVVNAPVVAS
jgi:hypothetical protein